MKQLGWKQTELLLSKYKLPLCKTALVKNLEQAKKAAKGMYPVAIKASSEKIIHKTERGGVAVNIRTEEELEKEFCAMQKKFSKELDGILIQEMVKGVELIVGMKKDPQFGATVMFGLGGIFVEVMKDVSFRIAPITAKEALEMMKEIKAYPVLEGARGQKCDTKAVAEIIEKISKLSAENKNIAELDFNPIIVNEKAAKIVDARIMAE